MPDPGEPARSGVLREVGFVGKLVIADDGRPRAYVQVQVVRGDQIITEIVDAPEDHEIDEYGAGPEAFLDYAAVQAKLALRRNGLRSV